MNVLHIITGLGTGGAEAMLFKLAKQHSYHSQTVISLTRGGKHKALLESSGISVLELNLKQFWMLPVRIVQVLKLIKKQDISVINAWMYHAMLFSSLLSFFSSNHHLKMIWNVRHSLQNIHKEKTSLRFVIKLLSKLTSKADAIIFNSQKSRIEHEKVWEMASKACFIPNGFECEKWQSKYEQTSTNRGQLLEMLGIDDGLIIGHVGRVHPMKNQQGLIDSFLKVADDNHSLHLVLIGKGTDSLRLPESEFSQRIHCLGERSDINELMPQFDFFSLCSNWGEGFPNVLGEAMLCGITCMATDVGDSRYLLNNDNWIVPPYSPEELTLKLKALTVLGKEERRKLGLRYRQRVLESFSIASVGQTYDKLYEKGSLEDVQK